MKDIESQLNDAASDARDKVSSMKLTGVAPYASGRVASRVLAAGGAFALVLGVVGIAAIAATWNPNAGANEFGTNGDGTSITTVTVADEDSPVAGDHDDDDSDDHDEEGESGATTTSLPDDDAVEDEHDDSTTSTTLDDDDSTTSTTLDDDEHDEHDDDGSTTTTTVDDHEEEEDDSVTTTTLDDDHTDGS